MSTITIDKNDFRLEAVKFLTSAMKNDKNDIRFHITHFKVEENGSAVSTDGHRLYFVKEGGLPIEPGYYVVHKELKTSVLIEKTHDLDSDEAIYPKYQNYLSIPNNCKEISLDCIESIFLNYADIIRSMCCSTINFYFIQDVCNSIECGTAYVPDMDKAHEEGTCNSLPIHIVSEKYHAAIMPIVRRL